MDKLKLVDKLIEKADISYEEAKNALEINNWDILEAILYLESLGKVKKPEVGEFYTNNYNGAYTNEAQELIIKVSDYEENNNSKGKNDFNGIFEILCRVIDTGNNIFLEVTRREKYIFRLPFTVMAVLLFFGFWGIIPVMIIGLIFDMEYSIVSKRFDSNVVNKANTVFKDLSAGAKDIKDKIMEHIHIQK